MNKSVKWPKNFSSGFLHEKIVFFSFSFLFVILSLDCFFQSLPISGYGLIVITLVLIVCATCITCHVIKWVINSSQPLQFCISEKTQNGKWLNLFLKYESEIFKELFSKNHQSFDSFRYPTNVNEQIRLLIKDIERDFVKTWYSKISQNPSFLFDSHLILEETFFKIVKKLKTVSCKNIIIHVLLLYLNHLQEYKKAMKKLARLNDEDESKPKVALPDLCRYSHPGSQSDQVLYYYLKKLTRSLLKEFAPHDFTVTLECKILAAIIGRSVFKRLLMTIEDPDWINLKLIFLLKRKKHEEMMGGGIYVVKQKAAVHEEGEFQFRKPILSQRYLTPNIFESNRNFFDRNEFHCENSAKVERKEAKPPEKELLSLPLYSGKSTLEDAKGNISTVLSGLISSTAGPLLPENISVRYKAFNKMWQSPVSEVKKDITNSFHKIFEGVKEKRVIFRSKSTESLAEMPASLKAKDISMGEELCESILFGSTETANGPQKPKKLTKTRSFDNESFLIEDRNDAAQEKTCCDAEDQRGVSPVYEEPQDFATTIAKLRSLLQQRESTSTLSDKSSLSLDSQSMGASLDKSDSSNKSQSLEADSFDSHVACDLPTDGRLFMKVIIPKGELMTDLSGSPFVLYTIQYDGIYMFKDERNPFSEPELVLQTTVVKRRFQEFLQLQTKLEESSMYRGFMKGVKGPSKWLQLKTGGKSDDSTMLSRRAILESFLRQLCSNPEISNSPELHEFLGYGHCGNDAFIKKDSDSSLQRIDKVGKGRKYLVAAVAECPRLLSSSAAGRSLTEQILASKVTGVFNSIKTALPSFDFDSAALVATNDTVRGLQEQKLLQNFLNFGNKNELFELNFTFVVKEPTGESLTDDIRRYFSERVDCIEDAVDVLNSSDWLAEQRECRFISSEEKCVWYGYKDFALEDELEPLDSWSPVYSLMLDIVCELLQDSDCWAVKEPVIRLAKVLSGHWERKFEKKLSSLDWDRIFANVIRLVRGVVFEAQECESREVDGLETAKVLKEVILGLIPSWMTEFVAAEGLSSAVSLFVDSFQHFRLNRDVLLRLMDILLVHLLSCHHLALDFKK